MTGFEAQGEMFDFWCPKGKTTRVHLVHVGKTAGKTVAALLKSNGVTVCQHHVVTKRYDVMSHSRWVVTTRDPISRTISAFNWGKEGGIQRTTFRTCGSSWCSLSPWKEMLQRRGWGRRGGRRPRLPHLPRFPLLPAHTSALLTVPCAPSLSSPDRPLGRLERRDTRHGAILATTARSSAHLQTTMAVRSVVVCNR